MRERQNPAEKTDSWAARYTMTLESPGDTAAVNTGTDDAPRIMLPELMVEVSVDLDARPPLAPEATASRSLQ